MIMVFNLSNLACLSTAGAANVVGRLNGVTAKLRAKVERACSDSQLAHFHCVIHQQNLCSKILNLDHVLRFVAKTVTCIRGRALSHHQFRQLMEDMGNQFSDVPCYT